MVLNITTEKMSEQLFTWLGTWDFQVNKTVQVDNSTTENTFLEYIFVSSRKTECNVAELLISYEI